MLEQRQEPVYVPHDKLMHMVVGMLLYGLVSTLSIHVAMIVVIMAAIGKEVYDMYNSDKHTAEVADAVYTVVAPIWLYIVEVVVK